MLWQILRADNVCTLWFRYFITVITVHAVEIFHSTIRCINRICKEVLYETFINISYSAFIFTKLSTKTLLLLRLCVSFEYQGLLQNTPASFLLLFVNVEDSLLTALQKSSNI